MTTIPPCILVAHDPLPRMRAAYGQELGSHCDLLFLPHLAPADRAAARARARVLIAQNPRVEITLGDVAAMTSLGFVQLLTAGVDHVPLHLFPRDVPIASNAGTFAGPMAEFVLAMTLAAAKRLPIEHQEMREGRFNQFVANKTLDGAVCAILGFGGVGRAAARLFRAFGAEIHAINRSGETDEEVTFVATMRELKTVLSTADVVVISLSLTGANRGADRRTRTRLDEGGCGPGQCCARRDRRSGRALPPSGRQQAVLRLPGIVVDRAGAARESFASTGPSSTCPT